MQLLVKAEVDETGVDKAEVEMQRQRWMRQRWMRQRWMRQWCVWLQQCIVALGGNVAQAEHQRQDINMLATKSRLQ